MPRPVPLRAAAPVVVLRAQCDGLEVLLLQRHARSGFAAEPLLARREAAADFNGSLADLDLGCLELLSDWRTPEAQPRRYDTAFFLARAPAGQVADHDRVETTGQRWVPPAAALAS